MADEEYNKLVRHVLANGVAHENTTAIFGYQMRFDLREGFPLLTTKRMYWKGVVEELLWFIRGSTDSQELAERGVHIWDANGSRDYLDSRGFAGREVGDLGPIYGKQWRDFGGVDQLARVIEQIRTDPTSRRIVLTAWNPSELAQMVLPPCHMICQFRVGGGRLSCMMTQRSGDVGLGVPFNIASYALLTTMIAHVCGLEPGELVHSLGDAHVYDSHVGPLEQQLGREPKAPPRLRIRRSVRSIDDFTIEDFDLNYDSHKALRMRLVV